MEISELNEVLENNIFFLQPPFEKIKYQFKNGVIIKDDTAFCKFQLKKGATDNFIMTYSDHVELVSPKEKLYTLIFGFDNILVTIEGDSRFPIIINFDSLRQNGSFTILKSK